MKTERCDVGSFAIKRDLPYMEQSDLTAHDVHNNEPFKFGAGQFVSFYQERNPDFYLNASPSRYKFYDLPTRL